MLQEEEEQAVQATQPPSSSVGFFIGDDNVSEEAATQRLRFLHDIGRYQFCHVVNKSALQFLRQCLCSKI